MTPSTMPPSVTSQTDESAQPFSHGAISTSLSVVIPALNEEECIYGVIENLVKKLESYAGFTEIIVVDDGSSDRTAEMARAAGARVIQHPYNIGNGASIKTGIRHAKGDWVAFMDADGQHSPEDLFQLLALMSKYDMVVGARTLKSKVSKFRTVGNTMLRLFAQWLVGQKIPDLTSGFRVMRQRKLSEFVNLLPNRFSYPSTITMAFIKSGYTVGYVPLDSIRRRAGGKSSIKPFRDGFRFLYIMARLAVLFEPMKLFMMISMAVLTLGLGMTVYQIMTIHGIHGASVLTVLAGLMIFFFGLLADQIAQLRMELRKAQFHELD
jgi:glycosyltransferase involved in cell wall biosynthesis